MLKSQHWAAGTAALIGCICIAGTAMAASPTTGSFDVQITIEADCQLAAGSLLDFGTQGALTAAVDQFVNLSITCTTGTAYTIALNEGDNAGTVGDVTTRRMESGGDFISYQLYSNTLRTAVWGQTSPTNTVTSTGTGAAQTFPVYGRVPAQTTPAPATYSDTITVTMTF